MQKGRLVAIFLSLLWDCTNCIDIVSCEQYSIDQLRSLSSTGIFESLELLEAKHSESKEGLYHKLCSLDVVMDSSHLVNPPFTTKVTVMEDLESGERSLAVEDLPVMRDDAIEDFWLKDAKNHLARKESLLADLQTTYVATSLTKLDPELDLQSSAALRAFLKASPDDAKLQRDIMQVLDRRLARLVEWEKQAGVAARNL